MPTTFWGKLDRPGPDPAMWQWHPLFDHCADVGAVVEALLSLPLWRERLARLAGRPLVDGDLARLSVLAALHDVGKLNLGFQAKGRTDLGPPAGHVQEAVAALARGNVLDFGAIAEWGDGVGPLLLSSICHHGRPFTQEAASARFQATWWKSAHGLDPSAACRELVDHCRAWFPQAFEAGQPLPDRPKFGHAFAGLVMLADWIGSDTRFFPFGALGQARMPLARTKAREAITALALAVPPVARADADGRPPFRRVAPAGYSARPAQEAIVSLANDAGGTLTILEAETGSGKTEAALARFVQLFEAGLVDGLYFALPTRSAATQLHARVVDAAQRAFASPPAVVLAVPGYLRVDAVDGERLPAFEVLWPDHERFRYRAWAAENSKRFLVGCIAIGTIDQVLLSTLMVGHAHLRATALLRHLLVVDEVHASDTYMQRVLEAVLERHLDAGGHALLLSATLGGEARERLLRPGGRITPPSFEAASAAPYPLITHRAGCGVQSQPIEADGHQRTVGVATRPWMADAERVARHAFEAATKGAKVIVLRNTVGDCIATQEQVERLAADGGCPEALFACCGRPAPHHARFAREDRQALDRALVREFGKDRRRGGRVVVATQTVQQSLDLDADLLITDLCPADVLLQRIGRLHRHPRERPPSFQEPAAVVLTPVVRGLASLIGDRGTAASFHGLGSVYPDLRIIEGTWRLLEQYPEWRIPEMNRLLVENALHSAILGRIVQSGGPRWRAHATQMIGATLGQARLAQLNLVDWSLPYCDCSFPESADERIQTRLGDSDRLVHFTPSAPGPFGNAVSELILPSWWVKGLDAALSEAQHVVSSEEVLRFDLGPHSLAYDRLGLRRAPRA